MVERKWREKENICMEKHEGNDLWSGEKVKEK
jgi:hypothetical protein